MSKGQKLWSKAKQIIPGGGMLLSKRPDLFLPDDWPAYFSKAKGCYIWDLDNKKYLDASIMGIGTNILGYANKRIDNAVKKNISKSNMSTFYCPEEVYLAEKLIDMHKWSNSARFARTGGEANAIAIRIARAATGKEKVAICGYHGWHDWYLATNLNSLNNLEPHLLPGLEPNGVPKSLEGTTIPFKFNDLEEIKRIVQENDLAAIKMEVQRSEEPKEGYLEAISNLCKKKGIVLIFDECTSGFRETYGGIHLKYKIEPDIALFGKALGNGYAITAILGKEEVMNSVQKTFMSSTFWTERIGPTAALKTLELMEKNNSWEYVTELGKYIQKSWSEIAKRCELPIKIYGIPALSFFSLKLKDWPKYKTFISQEMLKSRILASDKIYVCTSHNKKNINFYLEKLEEVFWKIKKIEGNNSIDDFLEGPVCTSGFSRLN